MIRSLRVAMTRWRTFLPSRWFSTIWMYVLESPTFAQQNMRAFPGGTTYCARTLRETAQPPVNLQTLDQRPPRRHVEHRIGQKGTRQRCTVFQRPSHPVVEVGQVSLYPNQLQNRLTKTS